MIDYKCPKCGNENWNPYGHDTYKGYKKRWQCTQCGKIIKEDKDDVKKEKVVILGKVKDKEKETFENVKKISEEVLNKLEKRERLVPQIKKGKLKPEKWLQLFSDLQYGLRVNPVEIGNLGEFNPQVAKGRLNYLVSTLGNILEYYPNKPEELYIACLGDNIENAYMRANQQSEVAFGICTQVIEVVELFVDMIVALSKYFPVIKVFAIVGGNHGRMGKKMNDAAPSDNYEYLIYHFVEQRLRDMENIHFSFTSARHMIVDIGGWKFWLEHGDTVRSWAGIPFYGIKREMNNINSMLGKFNEHADYLLAGHFHTKASFNEVFMNGSFPGGDSYSIGNLRLMDFPYQKLLGVNEKHGVVWDRNICLIDNPRKLKIKIYK